MNKIEKIIENKKHLLKFKIFHELKTKYFYFYQFTSKQKKRDNTNTKNVLAKFCEKCRHDLNEKDKKYLLLKYINNNDYKNFCASCNLNLNNLNSDESLDLNKVSIENFVLLNYEKKSLLSKIRDFLKSLLNNISNRQKVFLSKYFSRWNNLSKYGKYYSNIKNEYEKKYASKFEVKIKENNKILKKLDKEKVEITIKNESLLQIIQVNTLKINTFEEKEKNLDGKLKALTNEKNKVLSDLQKNEAHIDNKISNLENFVKELDIKVDKLTEDKQEKNIIISKYLDEMNHVLDYFEKKTNDLSKNNFYPNNDTWDISSRKKDYRDRSSSETKLKISSSAAHNQQSFLRSFTNRNKINLKDTRPLYIKNPYLDGFNTINPDFKKTMTGKYSTIMKASFLGTNK